MILCCSGPTDSDNFLGSRLENDIMQDMIWVEPDLAVIAGIVSRLYNLGNYHPTCSLAFAFMLSCNLVAG